MLFRSLRQVQQDSLKQIGMAEQRAADAASAVVKAEAEAAAAYALAEQLRQEKGELQSKIERETRRRQEAEQRASAAASAAVAIPKVPRIATSEQLQSVSAQLAAFRGVQVYMIELGDAEASRLSQQVIDAMHNAGWTVSVTRLGALVPPQYGIICTQIGRAHV